MWRVHEDRGDRDAFDALFTASFPTVVRLAQVFAEEEVDDVC